MCLNKALVTGHMGKMTWKWSMPWTVGFDLATLFVRVKLGTIRNSLVGLVTPNLLHSVPINLWSHTFESLGELFLEGDGSGGLNY